MAFHLKSRNVINWQYFHLCSKALEKVLFNWEILFVCLFVCLFVFLWVFCFCFCFVFCFVFLFRFVLFFCCCCFLLLFFFFVFFFCLFFCFCFFFVFLVFLFFCCCFFFCQQKHTLCPWKCYIYLNTDFGWTRPTLDTKVNMLWYGRRQS